MRRLKRWLIAATLVLVLGCARIKSIEFFPVPRLEFYQKCPKCPECVCPEQEEGENDDDG